jgi:aspartate/glutamate racemase
MAKRVIGILVGISLKSTLAYYDRLIKIYDEHYPDYYYPASCSIVLNGPGHITGYTFGKVETGTLTAKLRACADTFSMFVGPTFGPRELLR